MLTPRIRPSSAGLVPCNPFGWSRTHLGRRVTAHSAASGATFTKLSYPKEELLAGPQVSIASVRDRLATGDVAGIVIVDVRNPEERAAGYIKGSLHIPSPNFISGDTALLDATIADYKLDQPGKQVLFHCHHCSGRGPTSARAVSDRLKALGKEDVDVRYITGGVGAFMQEYATSDPELVVLPEDGWDGEDRH